MKKIITLCFLLLGWLNSAFGQATFNIDGFSKQYYGKVYYADTSALTTAGWVEVYDRITKKKLIHVDADDLSFDLHDGKIKANIAEFPYGEYSVLLYEDYNFDGRKDFAIMDGNNGCYNGPSFQIFLATNKGFVYNADFTELAQDNCGLFTINKKEKTLTTMIKNGCCWHQYSDYIVVNNCPKLIRTRTDDSSKSPIYTLTIEEWTGKKSIKKVFRGINLENELVKDYFMFHVDKVNKDVILYNLDDCLLYYAVLDAKKSVEFYYPADRLQEDSKFKYDKKNGKLTFSNKDAKYSIYDKSGTVGIDITYKGKTYQWKGNPKSQHGSMVKLLKTKLGNVAYQ